MHQYQFSVLRLALNWMWALVWLCRWDKLPALQLVTVQSTVFASSCDFQSSIEISNPEYIPSSYNSSYKEALLSLGFAHETLQSSKQPHLLPQRLTKISWPLPDASQLNPKQRPFSLCSSWDDQTISDRILELQLALPGSSRCASGPELCWEWVKTLWGYEHP